MLQGKGALEVRIQHAVREDHVGSAVTKQGIAPIAVPLPQAVDHHSIKAIKILRQPRPQPGCIAIASLRRPERVYRETLSLDIGDRRVIQADHLNRLRAAL